MKKYTKEEYELIVKMLQEGRNYAEVAEAVGGSTAYMKQINDGKVRLVVMLFEDVKFPIKMSKKDRNEMLLADKARGFSTQELADKYDMSDNAVRNLLYRIKK